MLVTYLLLFISSARLSVARPGAGDGSTIVFPGETENLRVARKYPSNRSDVETEVTKDAEADADAEVDPLEYLSKFGYLDQVSPRNPGISHLRHSFGEVHNAIKDFQEMAGIEVTGELDKATHDMMVMPRCGFPDKMTAKMAAYRTHGSRWQQSELKYHMGKYPDRTVISRREIDSIIDKAFKVWEASTNLRFRRTHSPSVADIKLDFYSGIHGSDEPFDGRGGVLAHAFFPRYGGDVHFDDSEYWINDKTQLYEAISGKQLLQTSVHEIGHSLGLEHSKDKHSIMAPFYRGWMETVKLDKDDVQGIQSIYGRGKHVVTTTSTTTTTTTTTTTARTTSRPRPTRTTSTRNPFRPLTTTPVPTANGGKDVCEGGGSFDAATETADGSFYVFRGDQYWKVKLTTAGVYPGYPRTTRDWSGLPGNIDAAFYNPADKMTYIFRNNQVGKYKNKNVQPGYPKGIAEEFLGAPEGDIDAALLWGRDENLYLFKGEFYWNFNLKAKSLIVGPRRISKGWPGVPANLSAAVRWTNGKSYFFQGAKYWRYDDDTFSVLSDTRVQYPRPVGKWWFGCGDDIERSRNPRKVFVWSD